MFEAHATYARFKDWLAPELPLPPQWSTRVFRFSPSWQLGIAFLLNLLSLALPIMMLQVYDRIIPHQAYGTLVMLIVGVGTALTLDATLRVIRSWLTGWTAATNEHAAGCAVIERFVDANLPEFEAAGTGTHMQNLAALPRLREFYSGQSLTAMVDLPFIVLYLALVGYLGAWLVCVPLLILAFFFVFARYAGDRLRRALELRSAADDRKANHIISVLTGIHTAKALAMEAPLMRRFEKHQEAVTDSSFHSALASGFAGTLSATFGQLSLILTATVGSYFVVHGYMTVGALSACSMLAGRALQPVQRVLGTWLRLQDFAVAREHAETLLSVPVQKRREQTLPDARGHLVMQGVSYGDAQDGQLLRDITFAIEPGETVVINGSKGSGKSTLLQLMAGILTPTEGQVWLDGINPALQGLGKMHSHVGYLSQQAAIFKGTILENLTGFDEDEDSVAAAKTVARRLGLDTVVDALAKGYGTQLNDTNADPIAPGIKQRVALSRVLRHQPSLLLFDDADRALDKEGYNFLFKYFGLMRGRCSLVIVSHDQNLASLASRSYFLENGSLIECERQASQRFFAAYEGG